METSFKYGGASEFIVRVVTSSSSTSKPETHDIYVNMKGDQYYEEDIPSSSSASGGNNNNTSLDTMATTTTRSMMRSRRELRRLVGGTVCTDPSPTAQRWSLYRNRIAVLLDNAEQTICSKDVEDVVRSSSM